MDLRANWGWNGLQKDWNGMESIENMNKQNITVSHKEARVLKLIIFVMTDTDMMATQI